MSGSTYTANEGKRMKHSDVEEEDEGNALSSSTPTETAATDDKMIVEYSGEGNVDLPLKKPEDETQDDVISESQLGDSSEMANQEELQNTAATSTKEGEFKRGKLLFELQLTGSDVEQGNLYIPGEEVVGYLPTGTPENAYIENIEISSTRNKRDWYTTLMYSPQDDSFMIQKGWQEFVDCHNLEIGDVIRFYRPIPSSHHNHFLIQHVKREEAKTDNNIPDFKQENFMFELQLAPDNVSFGCLVFPKEEVRKHFPVIQIPEAALKAERLKFTDAQGKDWCMKIIFYKDCDAYLVIKGWKEFAKQHNLDAMNVIKFYKPVWPSHTRHFLIDYVKEGEAGTKLPQLGSKLLLDMKKQLQDRAVKTPENGSNG